ncbi:MAG TPA: ribbon-helix-helix protein, CopG family [Methanocorpusculum sp.]|nr:ribbon-helix-helix protein, CopG family [Methanocorpusculum sp.]
MARLPRSVEKPEQVSLRLPKDLATKVDYFKDKEGVDRSTIIIRALRYWLEVDGHVTTDHEFMKRLDTIESESEMLRKTFQQNIEKTAVAFEKERQTYQELILKQQLTIDALLELVAKQEK